MLLVFAMAAVIWGIGAAMGVNREARLPMLGLLYVGVLAIQVALPDGHPMREVTGGSPALWVLLGVALALVLAYRFAWGKLKGVADAKAEANGIKPLEDNRPYSDTELERYARHIVLREIGGPGQQLLAKARVLVIGAGGLGAPALQYLAAAGVGTIGLIDDDVVDNANLQRQVIHTDARIGLPKVFSAQMAMEAQNPGIVVKPYHRRLTEDIAAELFAEFDVVLDGTDNFATRRIANKAAVATGIPLVSGALSQWEGQLTVFDSARDTPCYHCIFPDDPADGVAPSCAEAGVLGPLPGVVGSMMAVETIKLLTDAGSALRGEMLIYDALYGETRKIKITKRAECPVCGHSGIGKTV
ncbi:MAG: molybdopterin-synthase adenylyltransferase MoeB [Marinovum sp.]|nr:molybdopterin-synthase adenylyltransferase MoeB [Marinovum sp.]